MSWSNKIWKFSVEMIDPVSDCLELLEVRNTTNGFLEFKYDNVWIEDHQLYVVCAECI